MAFTEQEKVRIRHHTGYMNVGQVQTFSLGVPAAVETQFLIEGAMSRVLPEAEIEVRRIVGILDKIEAQKVEDLELLAINKIGEIDVNDAEQSKLDREYDKWVASLCNLLAIPRNPYDQRKMGSTGGINVRVC